MILIDTSVLSLAFRRKRRDLNREEKAAAFKLEELLARGEAVMIGPIRQEVLSGITNQEQYERLRRRLSAVNDLRMERDTFERAAEFANKCVVAGVAPGSVDMMICAAAWVYNTSIFSTDPDFVRYSGLLPIQIYVWAEGTNGKHPGK